jgi:hypothetical protein
MQYFNNNFSLKVTAIKHKVQASLKDSIKARAISKGLEIRVSKVICVTYNEDFSSR